MKNLEDLVNALAESHDATSQVKVKAETFADFTDTKGKHIHTKKLRPLQKSALGSFQAADADMLALLWNNREQIMWTLDQYRMLHGPGADSPGVQTLAQRFSEGAKAPFLARPRPDADIPAIRAKITARFANTLALLAK